jgi:hypothetical protein
MLIQWPDRYYHSSYDTPDKTDPASLALAVRCAATYAGFLASAGEAERRWLLGAVGRGARRRFLAAVDDPNSGRAIARERARGEHALASLARLGLDRAAIASARERLAAFARDELQRHEAPEAPPDPRTSPSADPPDTAPASPPPARWRRTLPVPVHAQRHLLGGWNALSSEARERWRAREEDQPDGALLCDVAWYACDGRRSPEEIARLVWLETGRYEPGFIGEFFELMGALGLSMPAGMEEAACSTEAPDTATR